MKEYIAAGFDPARFWAVTPRLYALEMEGAQLRMERELQRIEAARQHDRAMTWWAAMMPLVKKTPGFDEFVGLRAESRGERARRWTEAWDKVDRALERNR